MSTSVLRALRLAIVLASVAVAVVATAFAVASRETPTPAPLSLGSKAIEIAFPTALLTIVALGQLIASREPRHIVAWLFLLSGFGAEVTVAIQGYGLYGTLVAPGALPGPNVAVWLSGWIWALPYSLLVLVFLLFPNGRPPTPRWWLVAWITLASAIATVVAALFTPLPEAGFAETFPTLASDTASAIVFGASILGLVAIVLAAVAPVVRFRRASGEERQQLKWFAYPSGIAALTFAVASVSYQDTELVPLLAGLSSLSVLLIPAGAAVAILRYRLYDIDVVIERTLVYGALSAVVGVTYFVLVILLQGALRPLTGGGEIAVAGSTLATLALIQPLRTRIQRGVDRRFYRARYDAIRAVDAFSVRLRDEVALEAVRGDLLDAVGQTVQPVTASLWLRNDSRTAGE